MGQLRSPAAELQKNVYGTNLRLLVFSVLHYASMCLVREFFGVKRDVFYHGKAHKTQRHESGAKTAGGNTNYSRNLENTTDFGFAALEMSGDPFKTALA